ncbi:TPA: NUDIX domain-containing protein [Streptococcus agalactiae]|nr:NUDIX domain-containing protein [Streptococcus agalactiae]
MKQDYISYIRSKVGHETIFLTYSGGILTDGKGRVLLQLRADKNSWGIIGGCMELGESSVDTLKREFFEETGLRVEPIRLLNVYTNFQDSYPNGDKAQTIGFIYEVSCPKPVNIEGFHNEETLQLDYFSKEDVKNITIVNEQHQLILDEYFSQTFQMGR